MGEDVDAEIAPPGSESPIKHAEHADDGDVLPSLIGVKEAEDDALRDDGREDAAGEGVKLALQVAAEDHFFADAGGG